MITEQEVKQYFQKLSQRERMKKTESAEKAFLEGRLDQWLTQQARVAIKV